MTSPMKPWVVEYGDAATPEGFAAFNDATREESPRRGYEPTVLEVTPQNWATLRRVYAEVKRQVRYRRNEDPVWAYPDKNNYGDCRSIALLIRKRLVEAGIPRATLALTIVLDRDKLGHVVLMVRTGRGDYIIDSQIDTLVHWSMSGLVFLKRQKFERPFDWVALDPILVLAPEAGESP